MKLKIILVVMIITFISTVLMAQDTNMPVSIKNNGFEKIEENNIPLYWNINNPQNVRIDTETARSGKNSLLINHEDWNQSAIVSAAVDLKIGHLYKLSAWTKSENAVTNPIDRYPTSVAGCITMASFPFTNHSPTIGSTKEWHKIEVLFIATKKSDNIRLHLGYNGAAKGKVWFDDVSLEKVEDISEYIRPETVTWFDDAYRYDDRGWIFVHIEGKPYQRGYQYGYLVAGEMVEYMNKLGIEANKDNPEQGWKDFRFIADAFMLRKYETEYLTEMRGIADGANKAGSKLFDRKLDLIDVVTMNSAIDIKWARYAMRTTANPLSGQNFLKSEDELNIPDRLHKCSSFLANKSSTSDGRIVFGQIFMWGGYTGPHWNIICDVIPEQGHRLVYQTFPGGIHSGSDFYINDAGIMIGETTVSQTPFNPDGSPQSNRIRKAAQYAGSIDEVVKILTTNNNGMYANDWLIGDTKTDEIAVLLLGTYKHKLWRSKNNEFYGNTRDFYWCNNNNKDPEVRKEYVPNQDNSPHDLIFTPWNRDIAFNQFYQREKGNIDAIAGVNIWASAPINRPHACDGKITTSEMAENLVFLAHSGKVTLREKFIGENRRIPDLPGAVPRLSLGYSVPSPVFITKKLKAMRATQDNIENCNPGEENYSEVTDCYKFDQRKLWFNTIYPESAQENWFISATAAYWRILKEIPEKDMEVTAYIHNELADLNNRYLYVTNREGTLAPINAKRLYTQYNNYQVPRIKGTFLLHQLRLLLGNDRFSRTMNAVHDHYRESEMSNSDFITTVENSSDEKLKSFILQWLERDDLPQIIINAEIDSIGDKWQIMLDVSQSDRPWHFLTSVKIVMERESIFHIIEVDDAHKSFTFDTESKPLELVFNALNDIPENHENYFTWANFFDDFHHTKIVYGTKRQIEANHTLALRMSTMLADRYTEELKPVIKDSEISAQDLAENDLIVIGGISENNLMQNLADSLNLLQGKNMFVWRGKKYVRSDDGCFISLPSPFNKEKVVYLFNSNSAMQLYHMTKEWKRIPSWAVYKGDEIVEKGFHENPAFKIKF